MDRIGHILRRPQGDRHLNGIHRKDAPEENQEIPGEETVTSAAKRLGKHGERSNKRSRTGSDGNISCKPYVPQRADGNLHIHR